MQNIEYSLKFGSIRAFKKFSAKIFFRTTFFSKMAIFDQILEKSRFSTWRYLAGVASKCAEKFFAAFSAKKLLERGGPSHFSFLSILYGQVDFEKFFYS